MGYVVAVAGEEVQCTRTDDRVLVFICRPNRRRSTRAVSFKEGVGNSRCLADDPGQTFGEIIAQRHTCRGMCVRAIKTATGHVLLLSDLSKCKYSGLERRRRPVTIEYNELFVNLFSGCAV